jgi:hypothetical protein
MSRYTENRQHGVSATRDKLVELYWLVEAIDGDVSDCELGEMAPSLRYTRNGRTFEVRLTMVFDGKEGKK